MEVPDVGLDVVVGPPQKAHVSDQARLLRRLHDGPRPLLLPNVWDVNSARLVVAAGFPVVATSSSAVAASLGERDGDAIDVDLAFGVIARIASAVPVPITADIEAGYGLTPHELASRLLEAGAVGCNLEDSDHHGSGILVDTEGQAHRIEGLCSAAAKTGIPIVVNARTDVFLRNFGAPETRVAEAIRRGRTYLAAGASCVYPVGVTAEDEIRALVEGMGGPINIWLKPDTPTLEGLISIGVARVSLASGLHRIATASIERVLQALATGNSNEVFADFA